MLLRVAEDFLQRALRAEDEYEASPILLPFL
jgi:hypothetical protein